MSKRIYRAKSVKDVSLEQVLGRLSGDRVVFGVDVAKARPYGVVMTECGSVVETWRWEQPGETRELVGCLSALSERFRVEMVMESSGTYGDALRSCASACGVSVYQVHTKQVKDGAEIYDGVPSRHDAKCAAVISWLHLQGRSRPWGVTSESVRELRAGVRMLELSGKQEREHLSRLEGVLARHWPELLGLMSLDNACVLELLKEHGGPRGVRRDASGCRRLLQRVGGSFLARERVEAVVGSAQTTTGEAMLEGEEELVRYLATEARRGQQQGQKLHRRIEKLIEDHPEWSCCSAAVGKVTWAALLSSMGSLSSYSSSSSLVKAMGLNLKEASSGKRVGQLSITKRGPGRARYWLYFAALRLIQRDAVVRAWYESKVLRDGGLKSKAVVAVMRKLAKALWYVAQGQELDSRKLFDVSRLSLPSVEG